MLKDLTEMKIARRDLLVNSIKGGGALILSSSIPINALMAAEGALELAPVRELDPTSLDTWIAINEDGDVTVFWGKMDMGQGVDTAISQMVAEELDVDIESVNTVFGDTDVMADQGGASGSTGCTSSGVALREAAAEARLVLLEKASARLNTSVGNLDVVDGKVFVKGNQSRSVSYGELIGDQLFNVDLEWNGRYGNGLGLKSRATIKDPSTYKVVGTSVRRKDIAGKIIPEVDFAVHVRLPDMLHGRTIRPTVAGAKIQSVDESSISQAGMNRMRVFLPLQKKSMTLSDRLQWTKAVQSWMLVTSMRPCPDRVM
jgi:CO/xanthine dehydrogenase Mo-binding subunit